MIRRLETEYRKKIPFAHTERYMVTTWWFLFIPIYKHRKLVATNL